LVVIEKGKLIQLALGTIVSIVYFFVQLLARPYKKASDDYLASASSFSMIMVFLCSIFYKFATLTDSEDLQGKMSLEQKSDYLLPPLLLSFILILSVIGSLLAAACIAFCQVLDEKRKRMKMRLLKYVKTGEDVVCKPLADAQSFHLFLSHAWPAAQDRMRIVKARLLESLPSCRTFLDVDDLLNVLDVEAKVDTSECILVFCSNAYFTKKNSMKELFRAVVQKRPILVMLEPDVTQDGGLTQGAITDMLTSENLEVTDAMLHKKLSGVKFEWVQQSYAKWNEEGTLAPDAFKHAPSGAEVAAALFKKDPVEWNRLPHFQDVTIRLIAERGILDGMNKLYLQGEVASIKVKLSPQSKGFHLYCSSFNEGAKELVEELKTSNVWKTSNPSKDQPELKWTDELALCSRCDHMLVLLDARTWTSEEKTPKLVEEIESAMAEGIQLLCVHECPSVVGPSRHAC